MQTDRSLIVSVLATLALYCLVQFGIFFGFVLYHSIDDGILAVFSLSNLALHAVLVLFLSTQRRLFRIVPGEEVLTRVNLANRITLFRISSLPTIVGLLVIARSYPVMPVLLGLTIIVFLTDLLDGFVARTANQTTEIGKFLDSMSDYGILITISCAMAAYSLIPGWFFGLIIVRLLLQSFGMGILFFCQGFVKPRTTFLGKLSVFAIMTVYALELLGLLLGQAGTIAQVVLVFEIVASAIVVISLVEKAVLLAGSFGEFFKTKRAS